MTPSPLDALHGFTESAKKDILIGNCINDLERVHKLLNIEDTEEGQILDMDVVISKVKELQEENASLKQEIKTLIESIDNPRLFNKG